MLQATAAMMQPSTLLLLFHHLIATSGRQTTLWGRRRWSDTAVRCSCPGLDRKVKRRIGVIRSLKLIEFFFFPSSLLNLDLDLLPSTTTTNSPIPPRLFLCSNRRARWPRMPRCSLSSRRRCLHSGTLRPRRRRRQQPPPAGAAFFFFLFVVEKGQESRVSSDCSDEAQPDHKARSSFRRVDEGKCAGDC